MIRIMREARSVWIKFRGFFFGRMLPVGLALLLSAVLLSHMHSEILTACETVDTKGKGLVAEQCDRNSFSWKKMVETLASGKARNLSLLLIASIGWFFFYWRARIADQDAQTAKQNAKTAEKVLTAEQITRAIEQLAHEKPSVRLGGILGLEQVALTQKEERVKIARILVSFIRTRSRKNSEETGNDLDKIGFEKLESREAFSAYRERRLDVESAIRALASVASELEKQGQFRAEYNKSKIHLCDLQNTDLRGLRLDTVDLSNFNFLRTDFSGAWLTFTNFTKAGISLPSASLAEDEDITKFIEARLLGADFSNTTLTGVNFSRSSLSYAIFNNARLKNASFNKCRIQGARFENSKNLTQEQIDEAYYSDRVRTPVLPEGLIYRQPDDHDQHDSDIS